MPTRLPLLTLQELRPTVVRNSLSFSFPCILKVLCASYDGGGRFHCSLDHEQQPRPTWFAIQGPDEDQIIPPQWVVANLAVWGRPHRASLVYRKFSSDRQFESEDASSERAEIDESRPGNRTKSTPFKSISRRKGVTIPYADQEDGTCFLFSFPDVSRPRSRMSIRSC
jgi:hypothetical protein